MDVQSAPVFGGLPAGVVVPYAGATAPPGWLLCDGSLPLRATYPALHAVIAAAGYPYTGGAGDGSTNFAIPDLRGRVVAGIDAGQNRLTTTLAAAGGMGAVTLGGVGGEDNRVLTTSQLANHSHSHSHGAAGGGGFRTNVAGNASVNVGAGNTSAGGTDTNAQTAGGDAAHNNVQPTLILNYIISTG